ncbi:CRAL-TRIO domain-containing protein C23B6.04c [Ceratocystis platani]|uniref:CRAL-TRIO domain-containing protein C23B6.04c n=1 Tax=Ceratocystis fimbriata f. sp. platani TaxID=88771 RepID=A0A0F8BPC1_CERFI|nr:CRAL-TRIO domain-containing protein C23B6.04c [Ceratocystis platani]
MDQVVKTPLAQPAPGCTPSPRTPLTAEEETKYKSLLARSRGWAEVPSTKGKAGPLTDDERMWLTRECLERYLRATKWNEQEAEKRVLGTLTWRREFGLDELTPEHISPENETGKQMIYGFDKECRPCLYLSPGRQNTQASHRQVEHLAFMVERVLDLLPPGQETLALLINFKPAKGQKSSGPSLSLAKECLNMLQMHYPERLGRALIINVPWVIWGFFKLITPFIDPRTVVKLKFNEVMSQYVPEEQLWNEFEGGKLNFEYDHSVFWPALWKMTQDSKAARKERWVAGGKHIGEHESYLFGGDDKGLAASLAAGSAVAGKSEANNPKADANTTAVKAEKETSTA